MMKMQQGLTLIELAVVLTIIGLVVGSLLIPLTTQFDVANIQRTDMTLDQVKKALINYATMYSRLPCPASPTSETGIEDLTLCEGSGKDKDGNMRGTPSKEGLLPWASLGVDRYDAWGNSLRYLVDINYVKNITEELLESIGNNYSSNIVVEDNWGSSEVVAVIISDGKNGSLATTLGEIVVPPVFAAANVCATQAGKRICKQGDYVQNTSVLKGISTSELFHSLVSAGKLPHNTAAILTSLFHNQVQEKSGTREIVVEPTKDLNDDEFDPTIGFNDNELELDFGGVEGDTETKLETKTVEKEKWYSP